MNKLEKLVKKLDNLIKSLESMANEDDLLERVVEDLRIDAYNLQKVIELKNKR